MFYGCQALSTGVKPYELNKAITGLDGFKFWSTTNAQSDGSYNRFLAFVQRDGPDFDRQQRRINKRLLGGRFVLGPLLCYFVATLAIVNISTLTGNLIKYMFRKVMRRPIETLNVVTKDGIAQLSADQIADMTYKWLIGITGYIHSNSRAPESLDKADRCYRIYIAQCRNSDSSIDNMDSDGEIARDMLATDREKSQLFLGIRSSDLQQLYKYLVQMMSGSVSVPVVTYLRHVSESYIEKE
ncbi:hypothetical protein EV178_003522 [Coemansia sp. RSA 1646]|nr:hypothetical protein EV178_003522 [Coemansia sp. RSA 1646]